MFSGDRSPNVILRERFGAVISTKGRNLEALSVNSVTEESRRPFVEFTLSDIRFFTEPALSATRFFTSFRMTGSEGFRVRNIDRVIPNTANPDEPAAFAAMVKKAPQPKIPHRNKPGPDHP